MKTKSGSKVVTKSADEFLPLSPPVFHILLALADGEAHGYAIMQDVARRTGGAMRLGPGTLYGAISRMLEDGLIEESEERPDPEMDDARRRYYRLTYLGSSVLALETRRLAVLVRAARSSKAIRNMKPVEER
jgi:DNA-binding PadR family transcriptional regulator